MKKVMHAAVEIIFTSQTSACGSCHGCMKKYFSCTSMGEMFTYFRVQQLFSKVGFASAHKFL